ncbi:peptidyl-prolyl cis-trans isomerase FKBP53-like isoform X2 [Oryza brachyantha]|uniref:peptidyl-prolyl cis-trans isomerase FKBP53-like isoform X2 n=1 Tax=Oryza brachyantha TaxID=4533 RepID=UPI00077634D5|nr:peptidyl-prolyl cis-trans isomerase FKBP53-like isoform X2 [Oryza brachyantha]
MAFWGVEVKAGKPYTHRHDPSHGRLRICQATLGSCDSAARTVVQCNVGSKTPIILCSLNPKLAEMCHLEVELEEDDEVVFSVLGQSSIHLSGYYIRSSGRSSAGDDESESYGEDIGESDTDKEFNASDDSYESDFIDDSDIEVSEDKCKSHSVHDGDLCSTPDHHKEKGTVEKRRRLKKKHPADTSDDNKDDSPYKPAVRRNPNSIFASDTEDEDGMPISVSVAKKENAKDIDETKYPNGESNDEKKNNGTKKRKSDAISQDHAPLLDLTDDGLLVSKQEGRTKKKSKKKGGKQLEVEDGKQSNKIRTLEDGLIVEDLLTGNLDAEMASNGSKVYIKYVGTLQDGKIVESNIGEKPCKFKLGAGKVIRGWDVGISGMRVGDKRKLTIPPSMCYGSKAVGEVPKNSTIIYEIELVKVMP